MDLIQIISPIISFAALVVAVISIKDKRKHKEQDDLNKKINDLALEVSKREADIQRIDKCLATLSERSINEQKQAERLEDKLNKILDLLLE